MHWRLPALTVLSLLTAPYSKKTRGLTSAHILFSKWLRSVGELTDWNQPDLSCVIIIHLAVSDTSSNYFRQRMLYLHCAPQETLLFLFPLSCRSCSFVSLGKTYVRIIFGQLHLCSSWGFLCSEQYKGSRLPYWNKKDKLGMPCWLRRLRHQAWTAQSLVWANYRHLFYVVHYTSLSLYCVSPMMAIKKCTKIQQKRRTMIHFPAPSVATEPLGVVWGDIR